MTVLRILDSLLEAYHSRCQEFEADKVGATLVGKEKMLAILDLLTPGEAFLSNRYRILALFATHPSIKEQIKRLQEGL